MHPTVEHYRQFFEQLKGELADHPGARNNWIGYLFHITDVRNAASILSSSQLLSRRRAVTAEAMWNENAEEEIIGSTNEDITEYARLYFRPLNPTFFHTEGFKSQAQLKASKYSAHCRMPIALVFDAANVLSIPGTRFSDQNLATWSSSNAIQRTRAGLEALKQLPFRHIYHSATLYSDDPFRNAIIKHRNAEVIVPEQLSLKGTLVAIRTRSDAELETLRALLTPDTWSQYREITSTNNDSPLFYADRFFIERLWIVDGAIYITIHRPSKLSDRVGEFQATLRVDYIATSADPIVATFSLAASRGPTIHTRTGFVDSRQNVARITLYLDGNLAYQGTHWLTDGAVVYPSSK